MIYIFHIFDYYKKQYEVLIISWFFEIVCGFIYTYVAILIILLLLLHDVSHPRWRTKENIVEQLCARDSSFNQLGSLVKYISSHLIKDYTRLIQHATRGFSRICARFQLSYIIFSHLFFFFLFFSSMFIYKKVIIFITPSLHGQCVSNVTLRFF